MTSPGWALLVKEMNEDIVSIQEILCGKPKADYNKMLYTEHDLLRVEREAKKKLIELPIQILDTHGEYTIE